MAMFKGAFPVFLLVVISILPVVLTQTTPSPAPSPPPSWCIAQRKASNAQLQFALDWVCGPGKANCAPTLAGQPCFLPNNAKGHASWAFNDYYLKNNKAPGSCNFSFLATVTYHNPSYGSCIYPSQLLPNQTTP